MNVFNFQLKRRYVDLPRMHTVRGRLFKSTPALALTLTLVNAGRGWHDEKDYLNHTDSNSGGFFAIFEKNMI